MKKQNPLLAAIVPQLSLPPRGPSDFGLLLILLVCVPIFLMVFSHLVTAIHITHEVRAAELESVTDLLYFSDTSASHLLFPDGWARTELRNTELHAKDHQRIHRLFPNRNERAQVLDWGRTLTLAAIRKHLTAYHYQRTTPRLEAVGDVLGPLVDQGIGNDLAAHAAWQRLTAAPGAKPEDLFRLESIIRPETVPDFEALMTWAKTRGQQKQLTYRYEPKKIEFTVRPSPPSIRWFHLWILYEDWCVTQPMFEERKKWFLAQRRNRLHLDEVAWSEFLKFGKDVETSRRDRDPHFPPHSEQAMVIAALDRISGIEPEYSSILRDLAARLFSRPNNRVALDFDHAHQTYSIDTLTRMDLKAVDHSVIYFPNDSIYNAATWARHAISPAPLGAPIPYPLIDEELFLGPTLGWPDVQDGNSAAPEPSQAQRTFLIAFVFVLPFLGMRFVTTTLMGNLLLIHDQPRYQRFVRPFPFFELFEVLFLVSVTALAWSILPVRLGGYEPLLSTTSNLITGTVFAGLMGGLIFQAVENLIAVFLLYAGIRIEGLPWWLGWLSVDLMIGTLTTVSLMHYLENHGTSIALALVLGIGHAVALTLLTHFYEKKRGFQSPQIPPPPPARVDMKKSFGFFKSMKQGYFASNVVGLTFGVFAATSLAAYGAPFVSPKGCIIPFLGGILAIFALMPLGALLGGLIALLAPLPQRPRHGIAVLAGLIGGFLWIIPVRLIYLIPLGGFYNFVHLDTAFPVVNISIASLVTALVGAIIAIRVIRLR